MHTRERVVPVTVRVTTLKGPDAGLYYVEGLPSYYLDAGEPGGVWRGDGAFYLGLVGEAHDQDFLDLIAGLEPGSHEPLGRRYGEGSVRGFDVTASAPKSVSVLFAIGDDATRAAALDAHDAAVAAMVDWIEAHAQTRYRIHGEVAILDADGIAAACFRQHTSRALDPQLHTHVVIANRVAADDGRWLALDARTIKLDQRTLSAVYHASLRAELTRSLGVAWEEPVNGIAEMRDVPEEVRFEFSSRTRAVEARIEEKLDHFAEQFQRQPTPRERWRLEREAVTDSRPAKSHGDDAQTLHEQWADRAQAIGYEPERLVNRVRRQQHGRDVDEATREQVVATALDALAARQSTWRRAELVRELAAAVPTDITVPAEDLVPWLDRVADQVVAERLLDLSRPVPDGVAVRRDGRPVTESVVDRVLTTPEILAEEERLIAWAERRSAAGGGDVAIDAGEIERLSGPQRQVAGAVAGTRDLVLVVGPAGTGKTSAVAPAVDQLRRDGRAVFGVAPSAAAAEVLAEEVGLAADTLDKLLVEHQLQRPPDHRYDLPEGATVVVDEAGMVPTPKFAELATLADDRGWRLAFVGDPLQFSAVGRSGMFGHLIDCYGAIELDRVHRFANHWERDASLRLRRGDVEVLGLYDHHGRLHGGTRGRMEQAVLDAWWNARARGERAAMMAPTNEVVIVLNGLAQQRRADAGEIDLAGRSVTVGGYRLVVGDLVASRKNDRQIRTDRGLMIKNRDRWEVLAIDRDGGLTVCGSSGKVRLPADYVAQHIELAYAQTSHANQGRTVDRSFLLLDGSADCRGVYVPMTRGRLSNEAFVVLRGEETAVDILGQALTQDWIDEPAIARRAELARRVRSDGVHREPEGPLCAGELKELFEREAAVSQTLSTAISKLGAADDHLAQATNRQERLVAELAEAEERQRVARQVIDDYDHPVRRRLHRDELDSARRSLRQAASVIDQHLVELSGIEGRLPGLRLAQEEAQEVWRSRPVLERERQGIRQELDRDLNARKDGLAADPPDYLVGALGPRPDRVGATELWDRAAGRIDQHREAFSIQDEYEILGPRCPSWDPGAFATSQRAALTACDALDRSLGRALAIEPLGLELGL